LSKIDITKPLQLADGTKAAFSRVDTDGDIVVFVGDGRGMCYFNPHTGKHVFGFLPALMNVPEAAHAWSDVDPTKPLEDLEGHAVTLVGRTVTRDDGGEINIPCHGFGPHRIVYVTVDATGWGWPDYKPFLRNRAEVPAATLDTSKPLQTADGKPVKFLGTMSDGRLVVEVNYGRLTAPYATELRFADGRKSARNGVTSGDDLVVKVTKSTRFLNVYSDGTGSKSVHTTFEAARDNSKYGKVRVAVIEQQLEDGVVVSAKCMPSVEPWFRSRSFPKGRKATAADFA